MKPHWQVSLTPERCNYSVGPRPHLVGHDWFASTLDDFDLWFCTDGKGRLEVEGHKPVTLKRGSLILFRPGQVCQCWQEPRDPTLCMYYFHFDLLEPPGGKRIALEELASLPVVSEPGDPVFVEVLCQKILATLRSLEHPGTTRGDKALGLDLAGSLLRGLLLEVEWRSRVRSHLREAGFELSHYKIVMDLVGELHENPTAYLSVNDLARASGWSANHFTRVFKAVVGRTPSRMLVDLRIQRARELLLNTKLGTAEVAAALRYETPYFFYRQFKQKTGMTPTEFRANSVRHSPKRA